MQEIWQDLTAGPLFWAYVLMLAALVAVACRLRWRSEQIRHDADRFLPSRNIQPGLIDRDGTYWEVSWQCPELGEGSPMDGLFNREKSCFFRQIEPDSTPLPWWRWLVWALHQNPRWRRTGKTWEGGDYGAAGFTVLESYVARQRRR